MFFAHLAIPFFPRLRQIIVTAVLKFASKSLTHPASHLRTLGLAQTCGYNTPRETPHLHR